MRSKRCAVQNQGITKPERIPEHDPWATLYDAGTEEIIEAPDWRGSVVYMIEDKAT